MFTLAFLKYFARELYIFTPNRDASEGDTFLLDGILHTQCLS